MFPDSDGKSRISPIIELIVIAVLAEAIYLAACASGFLERLPQWLAKHNPGNIGELFIVFVFLSVAFGVFALRRWREVRGLLNLRDRRIDELSTSWRRAEIA